MSKSIYTRAVSTITLVSFWSSLIAPQVARAEERDRVLVADALAVERLLEHLVDGRQRLQQLVTWALPPLGDAHAATSSRTKRSSGTCGSSPASRAISRNVYRPARSRGPKLYRSFSK